MKALKRLKLTLAIIGITLLVVFFGAIIFRITVADFYPREVMKLAYTDPLKTYYLENGNTLPGAVTQKLASPGNTVPSKLDSKKYVDDGTFFANGLIWIPDASNLQITVRYNTLGLYSIAEYYGLNPEKFDPSKITYSLTVEYYDSESETSYERTYPIGAELADADFLFYHYTKVVFDGVEKDIDGIDAYWMRLDIGLEGSDKPYYGRILLYADTADSVQGEMQLETTPYTPGADEVPEN